MLKCSKLERQINRNAEAKFSVYVYMFVHRFPGVNQTAADRNPDDNHQTSLRATASSGLSVIREEATESSLSSLGQPGSSAIASSDSDTNTCVETDSAQFSDGEASDLSSESGCCEPFPLTTSSCRFLSPEEAEPFLECQAVSERLKQKNSFVICDAQKAHEAAYKESLLSYEEIEQELLRLGLSSPLSDGTDSVSSKRSNQSSKSVRTTLLRTVSSLIKHFDKRKGVAKKKLAMRRAEDASRIRTNGTQTSTTEPARNFDNETIIENDCDESEPTPKDVLRPLSVNGYVYEFCNGETASTVSSSVENDDIKAREVAADTGFESEGSNEVDTSSKAVVGCETAELPEAVETDEITHDSKSDFLSGQPSRDDSETVERTGSTEQSTTSLGSDSQFTVKQNNELSPEYPELVAETQNKQNKTCGQIDPSKFPEISNGYSQSRDDYKLLGKPLLASSTSSSSYLADNDICITSRPRCAQNQARPDQTEIYNVPVRIPQQPLSGEAQSSVQPLPLTLPYNQPCYPQRQPIQTQGYIPPNPLPPPLPRPPYAGVYPFPRPAFHPYPAFNPNYPRAGETPFTRPFYYRPAGPPQRLHHPYVDHNMEAYGSFEIYDNLPRRPRQLYYEDYDETDGYSDDDESDYDEDSYSENDTYGGHYQSYSNPRRSEYFHDAQDAMHRMYIARPPGDHPRYAKYYSGPWQSRPAYGPVPRFVDHRGAGNYSPNFWRAPNLQEPMRPPFNGGLRRAASFRPSTYGEASATRYTEPTYGDCYQRFPQTTAQDFYSDDTGRPVSSRLLRAHSFTAGHGKAPISSEYGRTSPTASVGNSLNRRPALPRSTERRPAAPTYGEFLKGFARELKESNLCHKGHQFRCELMEKIQKLVPIVHWESAARCYEQALKNYEQVSRSMRTPQAKENLSKKILQEIVSEALGEKSNLVRELTNFQPI